MQKLREILAILLIVVMVATLAASCKKKNDFGDEIEGIVSGIGNGSDSSDDPDSSEDNGSSGNNSGGTSNNGNSNDGSGSSGNNSGGTSNSGNSSGGSGDSTNKPKPPSPAEPDDTEVIDPYALEPQFDTYRSNTFVTTSNNHRLVSSTEVTETFRGVFPVEQYGRLEYCFYFSNNVDSTNAGGEVAYRNMPTDSYEIISAAVMVSKNLEPTTAGLTKRTDIKFDGKVSRKVDPYEMFWSDPVMFNVAQGEYLIFEWTVRYTAIPCNIINSYGAGYRVDSNGNLVKQSIPVPSMIGAKRDTKLNIAFIGDSVTAGQGAATFNGYVAQISKQLGETASVWNIGLGYARANDAVNSPAWLKKAKSADNVVICLGINDINSGVYNLGTRTASQIVYDISFIARKLKEAGKNVIIISTPPYTYGDAARIKKWKDVVAGTEAFAKADKYSFLDLTYLLGDQNSKPLYCSKPNDGHPSDEGCTIIANAFMKAYKDGSIILKK